jgi:hypothetical protein
MPSGRGRLAAGVLVLVGLATLFCAGFRFRESLLEVWTIQEFRWAASAEKPALARRLLNLGPRGRKMAMDWALTNMLHGSFEENETAKFREWFREPIHAEIQSLPGHPWAGVYSCGDGLGFNVAISVAPQSGLYYSWNGCLGLYDWNYGRIEEVKEETIKLELALDPKWNSFFYLSSELCRVRWGPRRYLIPRSQMLNFLNAVNEGSARDGTSFPLRREDQGLPASGLPEVPAEYRRWILESPISATITAVKSSVVEVKGRDGETSPITVTLDAGSEAGLIAGMRLTVREPRNTAWVELSEVAASSSNGRFRGSRRDEIPQVGWKLTAGSRLQEEEPAPGGQTR